MPMRPASSSLQKPLLPIEETTQVQAERGPRTTFKEKALFFLIGPRDPKAGIFEPLKNEFFLGWIICFAQVPESVAFAYLANVDPAIALHSAWMVGFICSVFGGRPAMVNGATGAFAAIIKTFIDEPKGDAKNGEGVEFLFPSVLVAGFVMTLMWAFRLGKFISLIPTTVMIGFCNGLAIVIGLAQLHSFQDKDTHEWVTGTELLWMLVITFTSMVVMEFVPKIPLRITRVVPSSILSIATSIVIEFAVVRNLGSETKTIGDISPFSSEMRSIKPFFLNDDYSTMPPFCVCVCVCVWLWL